MGDSITITVYSGLNDESRLAEEIARKAQLFLAVEYGIPVEVDVVKVPVSIEEARDMGLPTVIVEGREVSSGGVPLLADIIDAVFDEIREEYGLARTGLPEIGLAMV
ncbi:MAG: hypothetical protein F7C38_00690 [Desulfurococcales archaeon]|nr:hypothetical protein [Desulfurococcales archaeon]